jgi:uncharacterized protein (TIGR03067 family)
MAARWPLIVFWAYVLTTGTPPDDPHKREVERLQGDWKPVGAIMSGHKLTKEELGVADLDHAVFTDENVSLKKEGEKDSRAKYRLDTAKRPKVIDIVPEDGPYKGKTTRWIYALEGDARKLCYDADQLTRPPTGFTSTNDSDRVILFLQSVKRGIKNAESGPGRK